MSDHHNIPTEDKILMLDPQYVNVKDFEADGPILDIGGGGEGVIGKLKGDQVVAIDTSLEELKEAPPGPLKVVMDAANLTFLDESFAGATAFFTFMFIDPQNQQQVFNEIFRVLKPGSKFRIWEIVLEPVEDKNKQAIAFPIMIKLPQEEIRTGYGAPPPPHKYDIRHYVSLAQNAGFRGDDYDKEGQVFYLELSKP
ncbi:MAG: class I SAM-dependent methyltransferase [FCB group bacterium]|nr:class I SAM-dependent methyltransferase [FCB group bacterium]